MLHQKFVPIQEFEKSTGKNEYHHLYGKVVELKGDDITNENERFIEYGNDFLNCKLLHSIQ